MARLDKTSPASRKAARLAKNLRPLLRILPHRLVNHLPLSIALLERDRVGHQFVMARFALQLAVAFETRFADRARAQRRFDGASRFAIVRAVTEAALASSFGDFVEDRIDAFLRRPELQLAHAGRIDERGAVGQRDQLAMSRGV